MGVANIAEVPLAIERIMGLAKEIDAPVNVDELESKLKAFEQSAFTDIEVRVVRAIIESIIETDRDLRRDYGHGRFDSVKANPLNPNYIQAVIDLTGSERDPFTMF